MVNITIPGKNQEDADRKADEMQEEILAKQHAGPDFLMCRHGKRDWRGADPVCAFDESGKFREWNWNCILMSKVRSLMGHWAKPGSTSGHYWFDDDQNYGVLYIPSWIDRKQVDSYLMGAFVLLDWYKSRGRTDSFRILQRDIVRQGTEKDAEEIVRLYAEEIAKTFEDDEGVEVEE